MKGLRQGVSVKSRKGKNVSVERFSEWRNVISGKQMDSVQDGDCCSFRHGSDRGQQEQSSSPAPKTQTQIDERSPRKALVPREKVLLEGKVRLRANVTLKDMAQIRRVMFWHLPVCQNYISDSGCKFGDKCLFRHTEAAAQ